MERTKYLIHAPQKYLSPNCFCFRISRDVSSIVGTLFLLVWDVTWHLPAYTVYTHCLKTLWHLSSSASSSECLYMLSFFEWIEWWIVEARSNLLSFKCALPMRLVLLQHLASQPIVELWSTRWSFLSGRLRPESRLKTTSRVAPTPLVHSSRCEQHFWVWEPTTMGTSTGRYNTSCEHCLVASDLDCVWYSCPDAAVIGTPVLAKEGVCFSTNVVSIAQECVTFAGNPLWHGPEFHASQHDALLWRLEVEFDRFLWAQWFDWTPHDCQAVWAAGRSCWRATASGMLHLMSIELQLNKIFTCQWQHFHVIGLPVKQCHSWNCDLQFPRTSHIRSIHESNVTRDLLNLSPNLLHSCACWNITCWFCALWDFEWNVLYFRPATMYCDSKPCCCYESYP